MTSNKPLDEHNGSLQGIAALLETTDAEAQLLLDKLYQSGYAIVKIDRAGLVAPAMTRDSAEGYVLSTAFAVHLSAMPLRFAQMASMSHAIAVSRGWWADKETGLPAPRNFGELIALQHSEISEAMEGFRTDAQSDKLPGYTALEEELADLLHRIGDMAHAMQLRLGEAWVAKAEYNMRRKDHSLEARNKPGGKKF